MERIYKIGTRTSPLALKQVSEVLAFLREARPYFKAEIVGIDTYGDRDKFTPISRMEGTDFFTRDIDDALLEGRIDFAVHSAKDLPDSLREGLAIAAITESIDPHDVLVSKRGLKLGELPYGARIGTSSAGRKEALKRYRSDFEMVDIRGNVEERLNLLDDNRQLNLDAIVIAAAGLIRLGLENRITERIPFDIVRPHPLQGSLAVVTREADKELLESILL